MAAGVFQGKFTLTGVAVALDTLVGSANTYGSVAFRRVSGAALIGNSGLTIANGYPLIQGEQTIMNGGSIVGANLFLIGPGVVEFLGNATA